MRKQVKNKELLDNLVGILSRPTAQLVWPEGAMEDKCDWGKLRVAPKDWEKEPWTCPPSLFNWDFNPSKFRSHFKCTSMRTRGIRAAILKFDCDPPEDFEKFLQIEQQKFRLAYFEEAVSFSDTYRDVIGGKHPIIFGGICTYTEDGVRPGFRPSERHQINVFAPESKHLSDGLQIRTWDKNTRFLCTLFRMHAD